MILKISVFITSYNQKEYLSEAIESVLNQTLRPFEVIIVDDCSSDGSQKLIQHYAERYPGVIRPYFHDKNLGISKNKTFAQKQVRGEWLTYLDGDDRFLPEKLETEMAVLRKNPDARVAYSNFFYIDDGGRRTKQWLDGPLPDGDVFIDVFGRNFSRNNVFRNELVARECLDEIGFYDEELVTHEDWDFKIRLTSRYRVAASSACLSEYRIHDRNVSRVPMEQLFGQLMKVYQKNRWLLDERCAADKAAVEERLRNFFARRAYCIAREHIRNRQVSKGLKSYLSFLRNSPLKPTLTDVMNGILSGGKLASARR